MKPGIPNAYGLIGKASNAVQAYKRPLSSMSPTIILKNQKVKGLVGASGGPTIITGTIQTILNLIHFDGEQAEVGKAVNEPRIHHQWMPETLMYDEGMPQDSLSALLARKHKLKKWPMRFTSVQALWLIKTQTLQGDYKNILVGASDPSKLGKPAVVKKISR
jgi:gamma-glutamyltranspeptidase/glutathione hydrolase